jgi:hypothetical protein
MARKYGGAYRLIEVDAYTAGSWNALPIARCMALRQFIFRQRLCCYKSGSTNNRRIPRHYFILSCSGPGLLLHLILSF